MLMVVFGAGASHDSFHNKTPRDENNGSDPEEYRPPLASQLFLNRSAFQGWLERVHELDSVLPHLQRPAEGSTVEHELEMLRAPAQVNPSFRKTLAAVRFYLQSMLMDVERR